MPNVFDRKKKKKKIQNFGEFLSILDFINVRSEPRFRALRMIVKMKTSYLLRKLLKEHVNVCLKSTTTLT